MRTQSQQPPAPQPPQAEQLALLQDEGAGDPAQLERQKAMETYMRSPFLRRRYSSFEVLMADGVTGKSVRVGAAVMVRAQLKKTRGR